VEEVEDILKVLGEVAEHVRGRLARVIGPENEGRQLPALAAEGLPQFGLLARAR